MIHSLHHAHRPRRRLGTVAAALALTALPGLPGAADAVTPASVTPASDAVTSPTTTPDTSTSDTSATQRAKPRRGWPDARSTGPRPGTTLTSWRGTRTITKDGTVIRGRRIEGDVLVRASGVRIEDSLIVGSVRIDSDDDTSSMVLKRVEIDAGDVFKGAFDGTGIGSRNFKALRVDVHGGRRGINCEYRCVVRHSWVHDQDPDESGQAHQSAVRMGERSRIVHNKLQCNAPDIPPDAGCSADLTGYGDFGPVRDNLIKRNLFKASTGGTCVYGGSSGGKPYSGGARDIRFVDNVFERGKTGTCGYYAPVMDFDRGAPGNLFEGNRYRRGGSVRP